MDKEYFTSDIAFSAFSVRKRTRIEVSVSAVSVDAYASRAILYDGRYELQSLWSHFTDRRLCTL